jgi:hypothetical protein
MIMENIEGTQQSVVNGGVDVATICQRAIEKCSGADGRNGDNIGDDNQEMIISGTITRKLLYWGQ